MTDDRHTPPPPSDPAEADRVEKALRWRLILGRFADEHLSFDELETRAEGVYDERARASLSTRLEQGQTMDSPLSHIYDQEYAKRSHRTSSPTGPSTVNVPHWLARVRSLFPKEAAHVIEQDALIRYGMTELVTDPEILRNTEPTESLLRAIMQFKHMMKGEVLIAAREVVAKVVAQIAERLEKECGPSLHGVVDPERRGPPRSYRNLDVHRTIRRNLKNFDPERGQLVVDRLYFRHRQRHRRSYRVVIAVDQSGSMTDSLIHSAVMAAIFASLPSLSVHLVLWDHRVMDVTPLIEDPVDVLMSAQLGGGTRLLPAMRYCADLITEPEKTIFVILSDWYLWREEAECLALAQELSEAGVTGIGLNALDVACQPNYNERFARDLAGVGWFVATLTPRQLAEHVGKMVG